MNTLEKVKSDPRYKSLLELLKTPEEQKMAEAVVLQFVENMEKITNSLFNISPGMAKKMLQKVQESKE